MSAASNKSRPTRPFGNAGVFEDPDRIREVTNVMVSPDYEDRSVEESDSTLDHYESPIMDLMETDEFSVRAVRHRSASPGGGVGAGHGGDEKAHNGSEPHLEDESTKQASHSGNNHGCNEPLNTLTDAEWNNLISIFGENDIDQLASHCESGPFIDSTHDKRIKNTLDKVHDTLSWRESSLNDTKERSDMAVLAELISRVEHLCKSRALTAEKHTEELAAKDQHIDDLVKLQERLLRENQILQEKCEALVEKDQGIAETVKLQECLLHKNEIRWKISEVQKKGQRRDIKRLNKRIEMYRHETDKLIKENNHCAQIYSELQQKSKSIDMGLIKCRTRNASVRNALTKALLNVPDNTAMMRKGRIEDILHNLFLAVGAVRKDMECLFTPQDAPSAKVPSLSRANSQMQIQQYPQCPQPPQHRPQSNTVDYSSRRSDRCAPFFFITFYLAIPGSTCA